MGEWKGRAARPYRAGNAAAVRHGVWSSRRVDPLVEELVAGLVARRPEVLGYPETLMAWGRAEARALLLAEWFDARGMFDDEGTERPGLRFVQQFERLAMDLRARLGIDPVSEASLTRERAVAARETVDLDALRARGRAVIDAGTRMS